MASLTQASTTIAMARAAWATANMRATSANWSLAASSAIPDGMQKMKPSAVSAITVGGVLPVLRIMCRA